MKIPTFKRAHSFDDHNFEVKCMVARLKNSTIPSVGKRHRSETRSDPTYELVLLDEQGSSVSLWHSEMLRKLFLNDGLGQGIETGLKTMVSSGEMEFEPDALTKMGGGSFLDWVYLKTVILDGVKEIVCVFLGNEIDSNLQEHGLVLFLKNDEWVWSNDQEFETTYLCGIRDEDPRYPR